MSSRDVVIAEDGFGIVPRSRKPGRFEIVRRYTMTNENGASVRLISWGAGIQSICVPNRNGIFDDVVLGFDSMDGYLENRYVGRVIGRVINRISGGLMNIQNKVHHLSLNHDDNKNHFNGGFTAFDNVNWNSYVLDNEVVMTHLSRAGSEGYPGHMMTQVKYSWSNDNHLRVNIRAVATEATSANISNYCLINLAGHGSGPEELRKHVVTLNADKWTYMDIKDSLPTGSMLSVDRTAFDLREPTQLTKKRLYDVPGGGYNHNFCVCSPSCCCYRFHARILHPGSGRFLEVYSNHPGLQFYTGNDLPDPDRAYPPDFEDNFFCYCADSRSKSFRETKNLGTITRGKNCAKYRRHGAFAFSPQNHPNAVNISHFPSCILHPGKVYTHELSFKFGVTS